MGDVDSQPAADGDAKRADAAVELLRAGDHGQDNADVLRRLLQPLQQPRKGLGNHSRQGVRRPAGALAFRLRGLANQKIRLGRRKTSSRAGYRCDRQLLSDRNNYLNSNRLISDGYQVTATSNELSVLFFLASDINHIISRAGTAIFCKFPPEYYFFYEKVA